MSHTYIANYVHCVFSTKNRAKMIPSEIQPQLCTFMGGIARNNKFKALIVGGTDDHVHILLSLPATMPLAKAMQLLKGGSSHWMNETHVKEFEWQEGYGAFTLGVSQIPNTFSYIKNQSEHHRRRDYKQEFSAFLKRHRIDYDPKFVWG